VLTPLLEDVRSSNLTPASKTTIRQIVTDAVRMGDKIAALEAELAKLKEQRINKTVNQPSSKKAEWEKDDDKKGGKKGGKKKKRRRRKPGGKRKGSGNRSKEDLVPTEQVHHELSECPKCGSDLTEQDVIGQNKRVVEDIPPPPEATVVTEETADRKWCPTCQEIVSARYTLALPGSDLGLNVTILIAYMWVVMAQSLPNIQAYLSSFLSLEISNSGVSKLVIRIAGILEPVADEILTDVKAGNKIWADETGWRVRGVTWWLWAFANESAAYYFAAPTRGSVVVTQILGEAFFGVLITDGLASYNILRCLLKQACMAHIFRKIRHHIKEHPNARTILTFYTRLKGLLREGERLRERRKELGEEAFWRRLNLLRNRLDDLLNWPNPNRVLAKIIDQVRRQQDKILSFVLVEGCPSHNNYAEYIIRKGVLKRKVSGGSMSKEGAQAYAILQSIAQTCHLRGISFRRFLLASLLHYCRTGKPLLLSQYSARQTVAAKQAA
jgi:transposase